MVEDIKNIILYDEGDTINYEKIKIKSNKSVINSKDYKIEIMIPIVKKGKLNLYAVKMMTCNPDCENAGILTYIKNEKVEFAYVPVDVSKIFYNFFSIEKRFFETFEIVGRDYPQFINYLEEFKKLKNDKEYRKNLKEDFKLMNKEMKEKANNANNYKEKQ